MAELPPDVVAGVLTHMNADHTGDSLAIVQVNFAANAVSAEMTGLDSDEGVWTATYSDGSTREVRVPWGHPVETSEEVRKVVVAISKAAKQQIAGYDPDVVAARHLPPPPDPEEIRAFHERMRAGGSPFGH